jgi:hypothetical protein
MNGLLRDLRAFAMEHERCGELDGGVEGERVWMTCTCDPTLVARRDHPVDHLTVTI